MVRNIRQVRGILGLETYRASASLTYHPKPSQLENFMAGSRQLSLRVHAHFRIEPQDLRLPLKRFNTRDTVSDKENSVEPPYLNDGKNISFRRT
jgi:hypothetical protein